MRFVFVVVLLSLTSCQLTSKKEALEENKFVQIQLPADRSRAQYESVGTNGMISTQGTLSSKAGAEVIAQGGNLFDAFAAISFAIGVERPHSTGIGGGGFVLFYDAKEKKVYALDFRETAPRKAHSKIFLKPDGTVDPQKSLTGGLAVATPGLVKGVLEVHKKYGKLPLKDVLKPAIRMAEDGFPVYAALARAINLSKDKLSLFPSSKKIFFTAEGQPLPEKAILVQKDLARTLKLIAKKGSTAFYSGEIANKMEKAVSLEKGLMDAQDLASYKTKWRTPLKGTYDQYEIYSQPPPSSGGAHVIQILNMVEKDNLTQWGPQNPKSIHLTASAMQRAFIDRAQFMGDPDFVKVPVEKLISKEYAQKRREQIPLDKALRADEIQQKQEGFETTHFSLMDKEGNVIASTQTINGYFGSALVAEGTGIVLNNEMDDFAAQVGASNLFGAIGGKNNLVEPLKRPLSSMSPTIVMENGQPVLAVGTPSGTRIITCVAQTVLNVIEYNLPLWDAVSAVRYHHQWQPDQLQIEAPMFPSSTVQALKNLGYNVVEKDLGCRIQAIRREAGGLRGVSDPREEGSSLGF